MKVIELEPIQVQIKDLDGNVHVLDAKITNDVLIQIQKMNLKDDNVILDQMSIIFGNEKDFYKNFDFRYLTLAIKHVTEEVQKDNIKNPPK